MNRYEVSNPKNNELLNNIMKDQPIVTSGGSTANSKPIPTDSG